MKKFMVLLTGIMLAAALAACTPTETKQEKPSRQAPPAGAVQESTVDGAQEKMQMPVDTDPTVMVCVYSVKEDGTGLKQNMDAIDGEELDAQLLVDKMAELGVIEEGIEVLSFDNQDGVLVLDLSVLAAASDSKVVTAVANTFIQNYEAKELNLSIAGEPVGDGPMTFLKEYKKMN